ncbi:hypothetical protein SH580_18445 [Coraliomargarita algicola]|uniref:Yip1 domain-containing protein n=1 Tax=Coraliomargarita algicola TaxID=3092156 RepID=A0ABZ0RIV1_9BACT|nr:hypothetical protein [Coraliomargarita sp. J2-16]WPJ95403.1 hypothetical protein SH580_18445 [Coraliomargarita sp. J2-16]
MNKAIEEGNSQLGRLLAFGLSAASIGFASIAYFYGKEIATLPADRFEGGHGFSLNAPLMMYGAASLPFCYIGLLFLIAAVWGKWKEIIRFPNLITLVFLLPGILISASIVLMLIKG